MTTGNATHTTGLDRGVTLLVGVFALTSTLRAQQEPSTGIVYVVVHGTVVVKDSKVLPVKPGQPIRFPVEGKGRFEPVEVNKWLGAHSINVPDMQGLDDSGASTLTKQN